VPRRRRWLPPLISAFLLAGCADQPAASSAAPGAEDTPAPTVNEIATSSWRPGDPARTALIRGVLEFDAAGCPYLESGPVRLWVVWPAGYAAQVGPDGEVRLVTADGRTIRQGDEVEAGGVAAGLPAEAGTPCISPGTTLTIIESEVRVRPSP
jgi:hypothetical protein